VSRGDLLGIGAVLSRSAREIRTRESVAQIAAMGGAAIALVVGPFVFRRTGTPLSGQVSVATVTSILVAVLGGAAFATAYVRLARRTVRWRRRPMVWRVRDAAALTIAAAAMAAMAALAAYTVFQRMFQGLLLGRIAATLMTSMTVAAGCYLLTVIAQGMDSSGVAGLLGSFLAAGAVASTLSADDPGWWQSNFSALGVSTESSASAFNFTVITAGVVLTTLADFLALDLERWPGVTRRIVRVIRVLLIVIGLALIGLGTIPVDQSRLFHDINAVTVIVGFGGLILAAPILLRGLPRPFLVSTGLLGALIVGIVGLWKPFHVYNFTAVELLSVLVIFAWLALFSRTVSGGPSAQIEIEPEAEAVRTPAELEVVPPKPDPLPVPAAIEVKQGRQPGAVWLAAGIGLAAGAALVTLVRRKD
jgi:MFS family permease